VKIKEDRLNRGLPVTTLALKKAIATNLSVTPQYVGRILNRFQGKIPKK